MVSYGYSNNYILLHAGVCLDELLVSDDEAQHESIVDLYQSYLPGEGYLGEG